MRLESFPIPGSGEPRRSPSQAPCTREHARRVVTAPDLSCVCDLRISLRDVGICFRPWRDDYDCRAQGSENRLREPLTIAIFASKGREIVKRLVGLFLVLSFGISLYAQLAP